MKILVKHPKYKTSKYLYTYYKGRKKIKYYVVAWDNLQLNQESYQKHLLAKDCKLIYLPFWYNVKLKILKMFKTLKSRCGKWLNLKAT
jgi:hypothetical protein